jgi:hypothetical protein
MTRLPHRTGDEMSETEQTSLVQIEPQHLAAILIKPGGLDALLERIERDARIRAAELDISTERGRKAIASLSRTMVAGAKSQITAAALQLTEGWRAQTAAVTADRKKAEARLDALRDEVRRPLTEWENKEKDRVADHEKAIEEIRNWSNIPDDLTSDQIAGSLDMLREHDHVTRNWQEFDAIAQKLLSTTFENIERSLRLRQKQESDAAELANLRAEEAERQRLAAIQAQKDREERIAAEAAECARRDAENKAAWEAQEAQRQAEANRLDAERKLQEAARAKQDAEDRAKAAEERAESARIMEESRARQREIDAKRREQEVVDAERARAAKAQAEADAAAKRRAADVENKRRINGEIVTDLMAAGLSQGDAKAAVVAMASGKVRNILIEY